MLSAEITIGQDPVRCVEILDRMIRSIETAVEIGRNEALKLKMDKARIFRAAVVFAENLAGVGIIVFTRNGYLARVLSLLRPIRNPVFAFTGEPSVYDQLSLLWGGPFVYAAEE
ncbi:MAG: Pyruvate kinase [Verrucomicrobia subdivision 3 bacterium]|nr:Pyruvate kinase [Limisphaerales bacterium]MCS1416280.1 Pyruvate kinase [Limisphaerales bacterium]